LTHSGYWAPVSSAGDFRRLTAVVLRDALRDAGTTVCAPVSEFEVDFPAALISQVLRRLHAAGATPGPPELGTSRCHITGTMPTEQVHDFEQRLPAVTSGEGAFFSRPAGYEPIPGPPPVRHTR
jgi:ribosomal protection tetracycline resistance protein